MKFLKAWLGYKTCRKFDCLQFYFLNRNCDLIFVQVVSKVSNFSSFSLSFSKIFNSNVLRSHQIYTWRLSRAVSLSSRAPLWDLITVEISTTYEPWSMRKIVIFETVTTSCSLLARRKCFQYELVYYGRWISVRSCEGTRVATLVLKIFALGQ